MTFLKSVYKKRSLDMTHVLGLSAFIFSTLGGLSRELKIQTVLGQLFSQWPAARRGQGSSRQWALLSPWTGQLHSLRMASRSPWCPQVSGSLATPSG